MAKPERCKVCGGPSADNPSGCEDCPENQKPERTDTERLDWLEDNVHFPGPDGPKHGGRWEVYAIAGTTPEMQPRFNIQRQLKRFSDHESLRQAIDAAMDAEGECGGERIEGDG